MHMRLDGKLAWLYLMLISQVLIVMIYVVSTPTTEIISATTQTPVSFVKFASSKVIIILISLEVLIALLGWTSALCGSVIRI